MKMQKFEEDEGKEVQEFLVVWENLSDKDVVWTRDRVIRDAFASDTRVSAVRIKSQRAPDYWAVAINEGIRYLAQNFEIEGNDGLLVFSNEVTISKRLLSQMKKLLNQGNSVVGIRFPGFTGKSYEIPRNTCTLWNFMDILSLGCFSAECDTLGGMEDYFALLLLQSKGKSWAMISSPEAEIKIISPEYQDAKLATEAQAMERVKELFQDRESPP
jgi:hypothetical protein